MVYGCVLTQVLKSGGRWPDRRLGIFGCPSTHMKLNGAPSVGRPAGCPVLM